MLQLVRSAAIAPTAASTGAATVPTTPTVSGNSATGRSPCRITIRRTLPSWISSLTLLSSSSPSTLMVSHHVRSLATRLPPEEDDEERGRQVSSDAHGRGRLTFLWRRGAGPARDRPPGTPIVGYNERVRSTSRRPALLTAVARRGDG